MSEQMEWTPGPWKREGCTVYALQESGQYRKGVPILLNRFYAGVQTAGSLGAPYSEMVANATLMAAAPKLYEALRACVTRMGTLSYPEVKMAADALAEARGEGGAA